MTAEARRPGKDDPLVTVITPVFNGADYLAECIESVRRQTYPHWRYKIIDNRSTDASVEIARRYAAEDPRIEVLSNERHLDLMDNWNHAIRQLDPEARYCKVVHADDWLFPRCLEEMVELAEAHPEVGIVGAYRLEEDIPTLGTHLPHGQVVTPGRDVIRGELESRLFVLGSPSNILMRADLVRKTDPFYDPRYLHADKDAALRMLLEADFGFVFQVLTFTRRHNESQTSKAVRFETRKSEHLLMIKRYGPRIYDPERFQAYFQQRIGLHYRLLARAALRRPGKQFWDYQRTLFQQLGVPFSRLRLAKALAIESTDLRQSLRTLRQARHG